MKVLFAGIYPLTSFDLLFDRLLRKIMKHSTGFLVWMMKIYDDLSKWLQLILKGKSGYWVALIPKEKQ